MSAPTPATLRQAADLLDQADALIIAAGAGMGVDSGLPDFRGNEGFRSLLNKLTKAHQCRIRSGTFRMCQLCSESRRSTAMK